MKNIYKNIISIGTGLLLGCITFVSFLFYNATTFERHQPFFPLVSMFYTIGISVLTAIIFVVLFFLYFYKDTMDSKYKFNFFKFLLIISISFFSIWLWSWLNSNLTGGGITHYLLMPFPIKFSTTTSSIPQIFEQYYLPTSIYMNILFYVFSFLACYKKQ